MKRTEFETKLVQLEADYARSKYNVDELIAQIQFEMEEYDKEIASCKSRIRKLRHNLEQLKVLYLEDRAALFTEFEESGECIGELSDEEVE